MTDDSYIERAAELARESVERGWGGPFGAVIVRDGAILATGQNLVLRTGDPTAHAEVVAIRNAAAALYPSTLDAAQDGSQRARMLSGATLYSSSFPCPMCWGALTWARIGALVYGCDVADAAAVGFDDAFMYTDLAQPLDRRSIPIRQAGRDRALTAMQAWAALPERRRY